MKQVPKVIAEETGEALSWWVTQPEGIRKGSLEEVTLRQGLKVRLPKSQTDALYPAGLLELSGHVMNEE
jgi:hypothetical protein